MEKTLKDEISQELAQLETVYNIIIDFFVNYSFQLLGAVLILIIGLMVAKRVAKGVEKLCESKGIDITLSRFIGNVVKIVLVFMVALICLGKIGISVTPFLAAIGALSLGAGLALQGLLSNYAAGLNIILTRPFVVGDTIQVQGVSGLVKDILLAYTIINTEDDVTITIPNKHIVGEILHNSNHVSLLELSVGVSYDSDLDKVTKIIADAINNHADASEFKKSLVGISGFGDSSVDIEIRVWVDSIKLNAARFALNKVIWDVLKEAEISIPFPQREVQLIKAN
ncbi:MAG: mechanosensitive ion channel protein MscS [Gammaproteobacteria bacterium]|nr:MAG: mechanosensitive ion channel protein MscS [Gammaproteobacteria bacterium]